MNIKLEDIPLDEIQKYINDRNITDINWNGKELWVDDLAKGRYRVDEKLTPEFVKNLSTRLANLVNENFNRDNPLLEAETDDLRISIFHEAVAKTGRSISIRKIPVEKRVNREEILKKDYCPENILNFLENSVISHCNIIIGGLPSVGKTEFLKYLTGFIPEYERVMTLEDNLEIHYSKINPGKDCVEIKITEEFDFSKALKGALRHNAKWTLLSEARGKEVFHLLNSLTDGTHCLTTIHVDEVENIPDRLLTMTGNNTDDRFINNIYLLLDVAVVIKSNVKNGEEISRWIEQVAVFTRYNGENQCFVIYDEGKSNEEELYRCENEKIINKFKVEGIKNPFQPKKKSTFSVVNESGEFKNKKGGAMNQ